MVARVLDSIAARSDGPILLLGRVLIGILYLPSGFGKLTGIHGPGLQGFAHYLAGKGAPEPTIAWAVVAAVVEFFGSAALILGFKTRVVALLLVAFTIVAAILAHAFWASPPEQYQAHTPTSSRISRSAAG
jgi:putative oxidoreductase